HSNRQPITVATRNRQTRSASPGKPETRAQKNIKWIHDHCYVPEGKFVGQKLELPSLIQDDLRAIYDNPHDTRRAIITRGRKNAKSTECAAILLLHLCGPESKLNSNLYS